METSHNGPSRIKVFIYLILGFLLMVPAGAYLTEKVKELVANGRGYEADYMPCLGRSFYWNKEIGDAFDSIAEKNDYADSYRQTPEWKRLSKQKEHDMAFIHISGRVFVWLVSGLGLFIYFRRRGSGRPFNAIDGIAIFLGLFFMRDVVVDSVVLYLGRVPCDETTTWTFTGLPIWTSIKIITLLGWCLLAYIIYRIPGYYRWLFFLAGFIGAPAGTYAWMKLMSVGHKSELSRKMEKVAEGDSAYMFKARIHGTNDSFSLADYKDFIVIVDFFYTSCRPCIMAIPHINGLYHTYRDSGVAFISIDPFKNDHEKLDRFIRKYKPEYPVITADRDLAGHYGVKVYPSLFVISKGKIIRIFTGYDQNLENKLGDIIDRELSSSSVKL